jgi:hypothetical protein
LFNNYIHFPLAIFFQINFSIDHNERLTDEKAQNGENYSCNNGKHHTIAAKINYVEKIKKEGIIRMSCDNNIKGMEWILLFRILVYLLSLCSLLNAYLFISCHYLAA